MDDDQCDIMSSNCSDKRACSCSAGFVQSPGNPGKVLGCYSEISFLARDSSLQIFLEFSLAKEKEQFSILGGFLP